MISALNRLVDLVEKHLTEEFDVYALARELGTQPQLRFRLTVEGSIPMDTRIVDRPAFRLVGHAARVPLIHQGINPHIQQHITALPQQEHLRLKHSAGPSRGACCKSATTSTPTATSAAN